MSHSLQGEEFARFGNLRGLAQVSRQVLKINHVSSRHHAGVAQYILQFADISRPRVSEKASLGATRYACNGLVKLLGKDAHEVPHQKQQIFLTITELG